MIVKTDDSIWVCGHTGSGNLGNRGISTGVDIHGYAMQTAPVKPSGLTARTKLHTAFYDVAANAYYIDMVIRAIEKGIANGTSTTTFSPEKYVHRGNPSFPWKARNSAGSAISNPFSNVKESSYHYMATLWAHEKVLSLVPRFGQTFQAPGVWVVTYLWRLAGVL